MSPIVPSLEDRVQPRFGSSSTLWRKRKKYEEQDLARPAQSDPGTKR
jgi:hypothetical protein